MPALPAYDTLEAVPRALLCGLLRERGDAAWAAGYQHSWERNRAAWAAVLEALDAAASGRRPEQPAESPPRWLDRLVGEALGSMSRTWSFASAFLRVRLLERLELVAPAHDDTYVLAVVGGLVDGPAQSRAEVLRSDPELLAVLPRLFEVEGGGEVSLANVEKFATSGWRGTFLELVGDGTLDRREVMTWCLAALQRDFSAYRAGWFSALYKALDPTASEQADDQPAYRALLGSQVTATVSMAAGYLRQVASAGRLDVSELGALAPALLSRTKGPALDVVRLLVEVVRGRPDLADEVAAVAATALGHPSRDVQRAAAALVSSAGDEATVRAVGDQLAPAVQAELGISRVDHGGPPAVPSPPSAPADVRPVSPTDLLERTAALLESAADAVEVELVLRGLAAIPDAAALVAPLARRARTVLDRGPREGVTRGWLRGHLARLVLLAAGQQSPALPAPTARAAFLLARLGDVARVLDGTASPFEPLATPTAVDGLIAPDVLVARVQQVVEPSTVDVVAALLRLAPDGRAEALRDLTRDDELGAAVRHALGGSVRTGPASVDVWVAAARARAPRDDDELLLAAGLTAAGQGHAVRPALRLTGTPFNWQERGATRTGTNWSWQVDVPWDDSSGPVAQPSLARSAASPGWPGADLEDWIGWLALTLPLDLETAMTELCDPVLATPAGWAVLHDASRVLATMAEHPGAAGPFTATTLAAGLAAKRVDQRVLAVDAAAALASSGRLPVELLSQGIGVLAPMLPAPRLAGSLAQLASILHDRYVGDLLVALLPELDPATRGLHALLDVLLDESVSHGRRLDDVRLRDWLSRLTGSGRAAGAAKALLARS